MPSAVEVDRDCHPVDTVEIVAASREWAFDRPSPDEISLVVAGTGGDYTLSFTWMDDIESLHVSCAFDARAPKARRNELLELLALVNEQMWIGHFDLWQNENLVMFRHAIFLGGGAEASAHQCEAMIDVAVQACERYMPAFQYVIWAGKPAKEALAAVMFETLGEA
jgi:hypothetical protein